jgi:hypothetical protein
MRSPSDGEIEKNPEGFANVRSRVSPAESENGMWRMEFERTRTEWEEEEVKTERREKDI